MKQLIIAIQLIFFSSVLLAQDAKTYIHRGNELYEKQKFKQAEEDYRKAVENKNQSVPGSFNLGDALYKQKQYDKAAKNFENIISTTTDADVKAKAYHNLGNTMMESKKYQESIDAYKKSLLDNPKDDATRYNLAYAQQMLKKQQQQNKQNQNNQQKNQQNQSQNKNNNDKNNPDKKDQDKNNPNKNQNQQNKNDDNKDQQKQQQQNNGLSKEDAQRMLDALNNQEQDTQNKLKNKKAAAGQAYIQKDW